jgi:hypothetical protein
VEPITTTIAAHSPITDAETFRAVVLVWLGVVSVLLFALRPVLIDAIRLASDLRKEWDRRGKSSVLDRKDPSP